jgi:hypothetical protein
MTEREEVENGVHPDRQVLLRSPGEAHLAVEVFHPLRSLTGLCVTESEQQIVPRAFRESGVNDLAILKVVDDIPGLIVVLVNQAIADSKQHFGRKDHPQGPAADRKALPESAPENPEKGETGIEKDEENLHRGICW